MSVGRWLCAGAILDVGDISPLLFCSGKLDAGLRDLLQFQVASPAWFSIKGIGLELRKVNLGLLEPLLKLLEIAPLFFFFFSQKEDKNVHSSRAEILFIFFTAPFPVWTDPGT